MFQDTIIYGTNIIISLEFRFRSMIAKFLLIVVIHSVKIEYSSNK